MPAAPGTYSLASTPMRRSRHSSVSAEPVEIAMFGRSPSLWLRGKRNMPSGCGLS